MRQRAVVGLGYILDLHERGVGLGAGTHRADQRYSSVERPLYKGELGRERVYRVDDVVVTVGVEQRVGLRVLDVALYDVEPQLGIYVAQPLGEHLGLGPAYGRVQGDELAVDVARCDGVGVGDGHASHACAGYHLGGVGTDAAQSDHEHARAAQYVEFLLSEQQLGTFEPVIHLCRIVSNSWYRVVRPAPRALCRAPRQCGDIPRR